MSDIQKAKTMESNTQTIKIHDNLQQVVQLLKGLKLEAVNDSSNQGTPNPSPSLVQTGDDLQLTVSDKMACSYCSCDFADREEQKSHYKSDWHRFNLKQHLKGNRSVGVEQFEDMTSDISSISGSDTEDSSSDTENTQQTVTKREKNTTRNVLSDSEDESSYHIEGIGRRHPRVFVRNTEGQLMSIYRCVLYTKKTQPETVDELLSKVSSIPKETHWAVFMLAGGHFAGAIFNRNEIIAHKTFHRYVVRAKRGTAQSAFDNQGHFAKSGGAYMRRHHEMALIEDIKELISSWSENLEKCTKIFMRATGSAKNTFFNGKNPPLSRSDQRIRMIPFVTRRPTFKELQRVFDILSSIEIYGSDSTLEDHIKVSPKKPKPPTKAVPEPLQTPDVKTDESSSSDGEIEIHLGEETIDTQQLEQFECTTRPKNRQKKKKKKPQQGRHQKEPGHDIKDEQTYHLRNEMYTACKTGNTESLQSMLAVFTSTNNVEQTTEFMPTEKYMNTETIGESVIGSECTGVGDDVTDARIGQASGTKSSTDSIVNINLLNEPFGEHQVTLLHIAAMEGHKDCVSLLLHAGADPTIKDKKGLVPYGCCGTKDTRNEFRRFVAICPDKYDYSKAQIPGPLTDEMDQERKAKDAEKKKAKRKERKERLKDRKAEEAKRKEEEEEKKRYLALSDREKRAMAAEKRLATQLNIRGENLPALRRCFQCAVDMTEKIPFEYNGNIFCTTKCLQAHRKSTSSKS